MKAQTVPVLLTKRIFQKSHYKSTEYFTDNTKTYN